MAGVASKEIVFPQPESEQLVKELHFKLNGGRVEWWTTPFGENGDACFNGLQEAERFVAGYARAMGYIRAKMINCGRICEGISFEPQVISCRGYDTQLVQGRWQSRADRDGEVFIPERLNGCRYFAFLTGVEGETEEIPLGENQVLIRLKPPVPITTDEPLKVRTAEVVFAS